MAKKYYSINNEVFLIDAGWNDVIGLCANYLVKGEKICLIDGGTQEGSKDMINSFEALNLFPDFIILTHSHFDHTQGVPALREAAKKVGKDIEVFAHQSAIDRLEDQSFNKVFNEKATYNNIKDVNPLKEGDELDLGGNKLKIIEVPGHIPDHIAVLDDKYQILFTGDALGGQHIENFPLPTFMPPLFNKNDYFDSLNKLNNTDFQGIALAHYGYHEKDAAKKLMSNVLSTSEIWSKILDQADFKIKDHQRLFDDIARETSLNKEILRTMDVEVKPLMMKTMMSVINTFRRLLGKHPIAVSDMMFTEFMQWTIKGYYQDKGDLA